MRTRGVKQWVVDAFVQADRIAPRATTRFLTEMKTLAPGVSRRSRVGQSQVYGEYFGVILPRFVASLARKIERLKKTQPAAVEEAQRQLEAWNLRMMSERKRPRRQHDA
jgi:hypothetical protein